VLVLAALLAGKAVAAPKPGAARGAPSTPAGLGTDPGLPEDDGVSAARDAFRQGSAFAKQGQWVDALSAFRRSAALKSHPITTYDIAYCERALGRYARASLRFEEALAEPAEPEGPSLPPELSAEARKYLEEVKARIARVAITVDREDVTLRVDGHPLDAARPAKGEGPYLVAEEDVAEAPPRSRSFELWLDPGEHVFVVWRDGGVRNVENHTFTEGARVTLPLASEGAAAHPQPPAPTPRVVHEEARVDRTAAWITLGIGGAVLITSGVFAGLALSEKSSLDSDLACTNRICPDTYAGRESRMRTFADVATVTVVAGGVGVALGAYLFFTAKPPRSASAVLTPYFAGTSGGIAGRF
jgi:hypothetical protein